MTRARSGAAHRNKVRQVLGRSKGYSAARGKRYKAAKEQVARRFTSDRLVDDVSRLYAQALADKRGVETAV